MLFTNAYAANPLCSPTRSSILTGLYPDRTGVIYPVCHDPQERLHADLPDNAPPPYWLVPVRSATRLRKEFRTLSEDLKDAGYATAHFGKWHLGHEPYDPLHRGFDVDVPHFPGWGPEGGYLAPWKFYKGKGKPGEHIDEHMASDEARKFIIANKDRPFYVNFWCFSVHGPWVAKPQLVKKYKSLADEHNPQHHPVMATMIESMDSAVGELIRTIDEQGLADNTIIIFTSDNGGLDWGYKNLPGFGEMPITSNSPLRGGKAGLYEGGTREPLLVIWPGKVPRGSRCDQVVQSLDFYPTILEMLGLRARSGQKFDGISFVPALEGKKLERDTIFCNFPAHIPLEAGSDPGIYVRKGDWKLIRFYLGSPDHRCDRLELYNLKDDIGETKNLAGQMPAKVKELHALIDGYLADTHPLMPKPNPAYNPKAKWMGPRGTPAPKPPEPRAARDKQAVVTAADLRTRLEAASEDDGTLICDQ